MSLATERKEITAIVNRLLDNLSLTISSQTGHAGSSLRRKIGDLRASYEFRLADDTFATSLLDCFTSAREANAKLSAFVIAQNALFAETPVGEISKAIVQTAILYCLSAESRIVAAIEFVSRDDVEKMIGVMKDAFDTARELAADSNDSSAYQALTFLAGALTNHLANVSRPLPRMVTFHLPVTLPALALSNRIYYTAERWEEVILENKTIHPAFCQRDIVGLAS